MSPLTNLSSRRHGLMVGLGDFSDLSNLSDSMSDPLILSHVSAVDLFQV